MVCWDTILDESYVFYRVWWKFKLSFHEVFHLCLGEISHAKSLLVRCGFFHYFLFLCNMFSLFGSNFNGWLWWVFYFLDRCDVIVGKFQTRPWLFYFFMKRYKMFFVNVSLSKQYWWMNLSFFFWKIWWMCYYQFWHPCCFVNSRDDQWPLCPLSPPLWR